MMNIRTISKNKKITLIIVFLSVALVSLTIGYALMSSNLKINTTGMVTPASWRIHFIDSSSTTQGSATVSGLPEKTDTTELSYNCTLTKPGDQCKVDATIKNDGDINAKLALITKLDPTYTGKDEDIALMKENTVYNVKYNNIDSSIILSKNPTLTPGSEATVTIVFGYKREATTLPSNTISVSNLGVQLLYEQINTSDNNNPQGDPTGEDILYRRLIAKEASDKTYETGIKEISAKGNPDFSKTSTTDDGMYAMKDDVGTSYYYRGAVPDNWVSFAGFLWRVIRVNGDNTVRMIYSGTKASHTGEGTQIGTSAFNSTYNSPKYVGYMYGDTDATEEEAFTNKNNSIIKGVIDTWYQNNLSSYSGYLADEVFCNDRTLASTSTYSSSNSFDFAGFERLGTNKATPQLTCPNLARDGFTMTTASIGNRALTYPIGLITADEASLAGGVWGTDNNSYYLYTGQWYWALSASSWVSGFACVFNVGSYGGLDDSSVYNWEGARPVVSLRTSTLVTSGSGTETDPYVIE